MEKATKIFQIIVLKLYTILNLRRRDNLSDYNDFILNKVVIAEDNKRSYRQGCVLDKVPKRKFCLILSLQKFTCNNFFTLVVLARKYQTLRKGFELIL